VALFDGKWLGGLLDSLASPPGAGHFKTGGTSFPPIPESFLKTIPEYQEELRRRERAEQRRHRLREMYQEDGGASS